MAEQCEDDDVLINGDAIVESFRLADLLDRWLMARAELLARGAGSQCGGKVLITSEHVRQAFQQFQELLGH
jgi:hypothetical protein